MEDYVKELKSMYFSKPSRNSNTKKKKKKDSSWNYPSINESDNCWNISEESISDLEDWTGRKYEDRNTQTPVPGKEEEIPKLIIKHAENFKRLVKLYAWLES